MKKTMVYITQGIDEDFSHRILRARTPEEFHSACQDHLANDAPLEPTHPENSRLFCGFSELAEESEAANVRQ